MAQSPTNRSSGTKKRLPLFDWAESLAAKHGRRLEDISHVSMAAVPTICFGLGTWWQQAHEGSQLRIALAVATFATALLAALTWGARAVQSNIENKRVPIALHAMSLVGAVLVLMGVGSGFLYSEFVHAHRRGEQALQARVRADEERCLAERKNSIDKAKSAQWSARKKAQECQKDYEGQILTFKTAREHCRAHLDRLDTTKAQVAAAVAQPCLTGSTTPPR